MLEIGSKAKVKVRWKVNPYDYSPDKARSVVAKVSEKYGIPKSHVKVEPIFDVIASDVPGASAVNDVITNIQNPEFQQKLFKEYIEMNDVKDYDFDTIKSIDSAINANIDYDVYDKFRRYSIRWIRWSNFLSYGENNYFDFSNLKGLVLLNGEPANQSGKTTFAVDLIHFLLFGKTLKASTLDKVFNRYRKEDTEVVVEGCIVIDGEEYIIKRAITRPQLSRRSERSKASQKVEYYRIVGSHREELEEYVENENRENSIQTNKAIKEAIGKESDFNLIISVTEDNLDDLVKQKETERGRMLSRWIGLLPLERKDELARAQFNSEIKPYLLSNRYDVETLEQEIKAYGIETEKAKDAIKTIDDNTAELDKEIKTNEELKNALLSAKLKVDENVLKIDIITLDEKINTCIESGKKKKEEVEAFEKKLKEIGDVEFSINDFNKCNDKIQELSGKQAEFRERYKSLGETARKLKESQYCPTCGRKLENVNNEDRIREIQKNMEDVEKSGKEVSKKLDEEKKKRDEMSIKHDKYKEKSNISLQISALNVNIEKLRGEYLEHKSLKNEYLKNKEAIDKNNECDLKINVVNGKLTSFRSSRDKNIDDKSRLSKAIEQYGKEIDDRKKMINKLKEEQKLVKNWKVYLDMVGKNGISKMVLRRSLPVINANLSRLLNDVCDFSIEISITEKNDVVFYIVKDGTYADLSSGSGFEKTAAALALRAVLAGISTLPRLNYLIFDELWGRVAEENYDNMKKLIDKILIEYDFIMIISHLHQFNDYCDSQILVKKKDNVSTLTFIENRNAD